MKVELLAACDFAQDNFGKLTIVGVFDAINVRSLPAKHPYMCIAVRMRYMMYELGKHALRIEIRDPNDELLIQPFEGQIDVSTIEVDSGVRNIVLNHMGMEFREFGRHRIKIYFDGKEEAEIPLYINKAE